MSECFSIMDFKIKRKRKSLGILKIGIYNVLLSISKIKEICEESLKEEKPKKKQPDQLAHPAARMGNRVYKAVNITKKLLLQNCSLTTIRSDFPGNYR